MKYKIKLLMFISAVMLAQTDEVLDDQVEEILVKGKVLYTDQVCCS
jgi:hypothetical protein